MYCYDWVVFALRYASINHFLTASLHFSISALN